jgi:hypothetical protein
MQELRSQAQEAAEDIFFGQVVIIWARWFVIVAGMILILWSSTSVGELTTATLLVVPLIIINFFVHGRYLMERPANRTLLTGLSLADLIIIVIIVLTWQDQNGLQSNFFIFYYPVILAFAFVFPPQVSTVYTVVALVSYVGVCLLSDSSFVGDPVELERLVVRLITLAAMGGLATYYWRIQRDRRRGSVGMDATPKLQLES